MTVKKKNKDVVISFSVPKAHKNQLEIIARTTNVKRASLLQEAVALYLQRSYNNHSLPTQNLIGYRRDKFEAKKPQQRPYKKARINVILSTACKEKFDLIMAQTGATISFLLREAVEIYLQGCFIEQCQPNQRLLERRIK